jgi:hypothetical protein
MKRKSTPKDIEKFYEGVAQKAGYLDKETVRRVHLAMVQHVTFELKRDGISFIPFMGNFFLLNVKKRKTFMGNVTVMAYNIKDLKFYPLEKWKRYFALWSQSNGV